MAANTSGLGLRQYYRAVITRAWLVLLFAALVVGVVYWRIGSKPPSYTASTLVMITAPIVTVPTTTVGSDQGNSSQRNNMVTVINDFIQLLTTRPVTERVAKTLGLEAPERVQRSLKASRIRDTDLVKISATWNDREVAAKLANTSAEVLVAYFRDVSRKDAHEFRIFIEQQLVQVRARLDASDRAVESYKVRNGILVLDTEVSAASTAVTQARAERDTALKDLRETDARLATARTRLRDEKQMRLVSGTIKDNPAFLQSETRLIDLEIQKATMSQTFTALHPKMQALEGEIATLQQRMRSIAKKVVDNEINEANPVYDQVLTDIVNKEADRAMLLARIEALNFLERRRRMRNAQYPAVQMGLNQLVRENEVLADNYSDLSKKYQESLIRENEAGYFHAGVQVMEPAVAPSGKVGLRPLMQTGIAGLVGLLLGIIAAVLLETADDRIRTSGDAERALGAPVLAEVPDVTPVRAAPAAAALLFVVMMLLVGVTLGGALGNRDPQARPAITLSLHVVRSIEMIPAWLAEVVR